jgi:NADPH2:quinone reductase
MRRVYGELRRGSIDETDVLRVASNVFIREKNMTELSGLQLRSLVRESGELEISLMETPVPAPGDNEVVVRVEAAPINPSDLALLFGPADLSTMQVTGDGASAMLTARIPDKAMRAMAARVGQSLAVGNEGAGTVVAAGASAQALLGKTVAFVGGGSYAQYARAQVAQCLPLPDGVTAAEGAAAFVNPLTALGMVETMRREGHKALVHTAAASNLGQMLQRLCIEEHVPLVNIVRKPEQVEILKALGASYVVDSSAPTFTADLAAALAATQATLAFDAIGGGRLAGQILTAMEHAAVAGAKEYSRYGSNTFKQVYIYGSLDPGPTELARTFGLAWGIGGWLLFPFLQKVGAAAVQSLRARVIAGLKTTFASRYAKEVSLSEALRPEAVAVYAKRATGEKFLINPAR